jgi:hypothetical protein
MQLSYANKNFPKNPSTVGKKIKKNIEVNVQMEAKLVFQGHWQGVQFVYRQELFCFVVSYLQFISL